MNHQHTLIIYLQQLNPDRKTDSLSKRSLSSGSRGGKCRDREGFLLFPAQLGEGHFLSPLTQKKLNPQPLKVCPWAPTNNSQPVQGALSCRTMLTRQGHPPKKSTGHYICLLAGKWINPRLQRKKKSLTITNQSYTLFLLHAVTQK